MANLENWVFLFLGLLGGLFVSYLLWWWLNHKLVPEITFSPEVSRSNVDFYPSGVRYQIAIKNTGRRAAYNVRFRMRLKILDVRHSGGEIYDYVNLKLVNDEFFELKKGAMFRITPLPHLTGRFGTMVFPERIVDRYHSGRLGMDDIFNEWKDVAIFLEVLATDRFSGGMKFFRSPLYRKSDIRNGIFKGKDHDVIIAQSRTRGGRP